MVGAHLGLVSLITIGASFNQGMSLLSYLNPKQYAALQIARDMIAHSEDEKEMREDVRAIAVKDAGLSKRVILELAKFGYRISIDS